MHLSRIFIFDSTWKYNEQLEGMSLKDILEILQTKGAKIQKMIKGKQPYMLQRERKLKSH